MLVGRGNGRPCRRTGHRLQPRCPADPLEQLLRVPRTRPQGPQGEFAPRHLRRRHRQIGRRCGACPRQAGEERTPPSRRAGHRRRRRDAAEAHRQAPDGRRGRHAENVDRPRCKVRPALGLCEAGTPAGAGHAQRLGEDANRRFSVGEAEHRRTEAIGRSGSRRIGSPRRLRPDRPAADAEGSRRLPR